MQSESENKAPDLHVEFDNQLEEFSRRNLSAQSFPAFTYLSEKTNYYSQYFLVNSEILYIKSHGTPDEDDMRLAIKGLEKLLMQLGVGKIYFLWEIVDARHISIKVRKILIQLNERFADQCLEQYIVATTFIKTIFSIYKLIKPKHSVNLKLVSTTAEALDQILNKDAESDQPGAFTPGISREQLNNLSKKELIDMILDMEKRHAVRTREIMETIGQISWDGEFKPMQIDTHESDPFHELFNAITLLQYDAYEVIGDLLDLNQNLELKVAERIMDLIDTESNLRAILDNSGSIVWLINNRYELIDFNANFGKEIEQRFKIIPALNKNILEYIPDSNERMEWKRRFDRALEGKPGIYIDQIIEKEEEIVYEIKTFPIKEIGNIKGVSVFIKDITDIKRAELKLLEKNRDLEKVNKELDSFVYRVSHDLRAPLTSILGLINLIKLEEDQEKLRYYFELQEKSVKKLDRFIKDIINLSRNSRLGVAIERIDFNKMAGDIFESQHYYDNHLKIEKRLVVNGEEPFYSDNQRLSIILSNLVSNSIKYANLSRKDAFVEIEVLVTTDQCVIKIRDNGIGIAPEYLNKIFTMFFRASQDDNGSGLGLYIVKETIDKLSGTIQVKSKLREGTSFTVTIPNLKERFKAVLNM